MKKKKRSNYKRSRDKFNRNIPEKYYTKDDFFYSRIASILMIPRGKVRSIFSERAITIIRLNSLKGNSEETKEALMKKGYELEEIPWAKDVFFVKNKDKSEVSQSVEYTEGKYYIQNLSSILATLILNPKNGEKILDMCAAPGSKSTYIADLTCGEASILANDIDMKRVNDLRDVVKQFGAENIRIALSDGKEFGYKYPACFDNVLLDAPCSGEGLINMSSPRPLRYWSMDKVKRCTFIQKELIVSAFKSLKHGKSMVYSTCTLEPDENEGVVTHLLNSFPNARIEKIDLIDEIRKSMPELSEYIKSGITKWSGNRYDSRVKDTIRIIPNSKMMGFYIAKIFKE